MPRPKFAIGTSSERSRSTSRDRVDLEQGDRRGRHNSSVSYTNSSTGRIEEDGEDGEQGSETDAFLSTTSGSPRKGSARTGSVSYGAMDTSPHHYIQLKNPPVGGLARNESIFKMSGMIDDNGGEFEHYRMSEADMKPFSSKIKAFYRAQNEILDDFAEVDEILDNTRAIVQAAHAAGTTMPSVRLTRPGPPAEDALNIKVKVAINVNFLVNFLLLGAKIIIVLLSNSMSLIASTVDSAMDFLSTVIIFGTSQVMEHRDWKSAYNYPTGKTRMEPVSVLVFSVFMIASFLQVFIESVQRLADSHLVAAEIPFLGFVVMISTILIKLVVWWWFRSIKNSSVEALTQDAENDIVFNFFSILFPLIGQWLGLPILDPLGGALLSVYIVVEWSKTLLSTVQKLTGKRASPRQHQKAAYLLTRFSPLVSGIQHLSVYHTGDKYIVEADVVLPPLTNLTVAHNVAESAQYGLEQLEGVERAYVHVDVDFSTQNAGHVNR